MRRQWYDSLMHMTSPQENLVDLTSRFASPGGSQGDATSERILDAALELLARVGIRRTSINDVARRAGVARATVFRKFATKEDLVRAVALREAARVMSETQAALAETENVDERLTEAFVRTFKAARKHPLITGLLEVEPETVVELLTKPGAPIVALGAAMLVPSLRTDWNRADADRVAELLVRIGISLTLAPTSTFPLDTDHEIRAFARTYLHPIVTAQP